MGSKFEGGGNGNDNGKEDRVVPFPSKARRLGDSAGYYRRTPQVSSTNETLGADRADHEPLTNEECLEFAQDINTAFTEIIEAHPEWELSEEKIEEKVALLLQEADNNPRNLVSYFEEAMRRDVALVKEDVLLHLAAAKAYLDILDLRKNQEAPDL